jgi:hypothetical protein
MFKTADSAEVVGRIRFVFDRIAQLAPWVRVLEGHTLSPIDSIALMAVRARKKRKKLRVLDSSRTLKSTTPELEVHHASIPARLPLASAQIGVHYSENRR